ncbi:MAPEG family protein [Roseibium litorale]|uniref:MAPEG family protein n=1 Tax=Roseibium litorale TaxID=2803841 RepID=A0ABR9CLS9_9HYPH|nr:MAPEG family protein [Roseibium litorale]MBD8891816.1 MAPEG family protein [Roseibium litorale]
MPIAVWCILIAAILPIAAVFPAKLSKDFDNAKPRDPNYWKDGFRARAQSAQANGFEAFPFFAAAVIVGLGQGGDTVWIDRLAELFIGLRIIYTLCYWTDRATPRSLAWIAGFAATLAIFTSPVWS